MVARAAQLSPIEYDQQRHALAEQINVRVSTLDAEVERARQASAPETVSRDKAIVLDDTEPWVDPVDGTELLRELVQTFRRYVVLNQSAAVALALWVLLTYVFNHFNICPYLGIVSPVKRCGKTRLVTLLAMLCHRALPASNITPAALFRSIEEWSPTLLVDEADTFLPGNDDLRGILNSGQARDLAFVVRTVEVQREHTVEQFSTWGPKAIAMIGKLPDTLHDRAIEIRLERKKVSEKMPRLKAGKEFSDIRRRCLRWAEDNGPKLEGMEPVIPEGLHDRAGDNWEPLLAIADHVGGRLPEAARTAALALVEIDTDNESAGVMLLADTRTILANWQDEYISSAQLVERLVDLEDRPWGEWSKGKPITKNKLATLLKRFGIRSRSVRLRDGSTPKGYPCDGFEDAFSRYLPPLGNATTPQPIQDNGLRHFQNATPGVDVAFPNQRKTAPDNGCGDVAFQAGGTSSTHTKDGECRARDSDEPDVYEPGSDVGLEHEEVVL